MKHTLNLLVLLITVNCYAQVKIGNNPTVLNPSSLLELESSNKSLLISRVADTNAITTPINGMIIYDLSSKCFKGFQDGAWTDCGFVAYPKPNSVLIQVGNEADNPNVIPSVVTATQLASVPGVVGVITTNEKAYQTYIDANPNLFSSPATIAEVQAMVTAVNANVNAILVQIGNEGDNPNVIPSVVTVAQITSLGVTGVVTSNEKAYQTYIDANPNLFSSPATIVEVQAMVTAVNANVNAILVQIGNEGDSPNVIPSVVTVAQITSLGVTGVVTSNEKAYQTYIDANPNLFSSPATIAEVQAMVTAVNANVNAILVQIGNEGDSPNVIPSVVTVAQITSLGVSCVVTTSQTQYQNYIDANPNSFSSPATIAQVQAMTTTLAAFPPNILNCGTSVSITPGNSVSTTATGGDGGVITWSVSPTTGVSTTSGTGLSTGAITFNTQGTYTLTYTATKTPPQGCGTTTTSSCTKTITVSSFLLSGTGFESSGSACLLNTSIPIFNGAFSDGVYKGYVADVTPLVSGNFQLDIQGGTGCTTYGTAWSGNKFLGLAAGDGLTIDLGANLIPGSTFTMTMYERAPTLTPSPYRVGISNTAGVSGGPSYNNLFSTTGPTTNTWTARTITFTVPNVTGYRYLTIESTNANGIAGWTCLDF